MGGRVGEWAGAATSGRSPLKEQRAGAGGGCQTATHKLKARLSAIQGNRPANKGCRGCS
jgi:hypothetical protein